MIPNCEQIQSVLAGWLASRLDAPSLAWVNDRQAAIRTGDKKALFLSFGLAPRKVGKADLALTADELSAAGRLRPGWNPKGWSVDQAARALFVLAFPSQDPAAYVAVLDQLFAAGEVGELVALYQALPLLPHPAQHVLRAAEGIRTNIKAVFCAVAWQNPFPSEQFTDDQWNQMVLKCQFIDVPLSPVVGLDQRANPRLASMVDDFIHERWAAKRPVSAEMWRCVGRFADARMLNDLKQVLATGSNLDRQAAALALSECPDPVAKQLLASSPELEQKIAAGAINWAAIAQGKTG